MNTAIVFLYLINFIYIGLLPKIFFRKGQFNLRWFITALPFMAGIVLFALELILPVGMKPSEHFALLLPNIWPNLLMLISVAISAASIAIIAWTIGSHHIPISLWHQQDDAPKNIVTHGPYAYVRHPFYTAFLLLLMGAFLVFPTIATLSMLAYGMLQLNLTAAREEKRLSHSKFGEAYQHYLSQTNRFIPIKMGIKA